MTTEPTIVIFIDDNGQGHLPGDTLTGEYWVNGLHSCRVKSIEASVLWHTEGKGDEDMAVCAFWRRESERDKPLDPARPEAFRVTLPNSPLSYEGQIVKVRWCVRVRVFLNRRRELVAEKVFQLGHVPRIRD